MIRARMLARGGSNDAGAHRTRRPPAAASGRPFQLELARNGATVTVEPGVSVLDAALRAGASVLSSCRRGLCGTCEATVLEGRPDHRDSLLDDEERAGGDRMFVCVSRSAGDRLVLDL